jgi:hypothetical protein
MSEVTGKRDELQENIPASNPREDLTRARRRRLLLGAAAIPTVYTLTSGAGVAAASLTCWDRSLQTATPAPVTAAPDQWVRAPMKSGTTGTGWKTMGYCMKDPAKQAECTDPLQTDWSAAQTYWYVNGQKTLEAQGGVRFIPKTPGYGLLYIDRTGTVKTFDPSSYPGIDLRYTATSCWNSMASTSISTLG